MIDVDVELEAGGVAVRCGFQDTLSVRCYVQLVSGDHGGYHEGECLEGGREAGHVFTDLEAGTYTVLVYGLDSRQPSCLPSDHHDYIAVITVTSGAQTSSSEMSPSLTPQTSKNSNCISPGYSVLFHLIRC